MFTSTQIAGILEEISETASTKQKEQLIAKHGGDSTFQKVLFQSLNPFITYGLRQVPAQSEPGVGEFTDGTWKILDNLASRYITGNTARQAVQDEINRLNEPSANLLKWVITKDLRAGISDSIVNKAIKGLIPSPPYMRCCLPKDTKVEKFDWVDGVFSQEKADGMFANVNVDHGGFVMATSRSGSLLPISKFPGFVEDVQAVLKHGTQSHGELLVLRDNIVLAREIGNGIINSACEDGELAENERVVFMAWDQIPLEFAVTKGKYTVPYKTRFTELRTQVDAAANSISAVRLIPTRIVHSLNDAYKHYGEMLLVDKEGTVIKDPRAVWRDGTSKEQVKLKLAFEIDLVVVGFEEGNGKNAATFGSIVCRTSDGLLEVAVSGFKDKPQPGILTRSQIWDMREEIVGTIMTVRANDLMSPTEAKTTYSLFSPRFVEFRKDKTTADNLKRVVEQYEAAKQAGIEA